MRTAQELLAVSEVAQHARENQIMESWGAQCESAAAMGMTKCMILIDMSDRRKFDKDYVIDEVTKLGYGVNLIDDSRIEIWW